MIENVVSNPFDMTPETIGDYEVTPFATFEYDGKTYVVCVPHDQEDEDITDYFIAELEQETSDTHRVFSAVPLEEEEELFYQVLCNMWESYYEEHVEEIEIAWEE